MNVKPSFAGVVTEIITPFGENGELDEALLREEVEQQVKSGVQGLFTNGLASECLSMTMEEKKEATRIVCSQTKGRIPVMSNITGNHYEECKELLKASKEAGADAVALTQPLVYSCTQDGIYDFFSDLIRESDLPVCIYNAPQTCNTLSPSTVARLLNEHEEVLYYKESTIDVVHMQNTMRLINRDKGYEFLAGSDASILPVASLGGKGVISLISAVFPEIILQLWSEIQDGQTEQARNTQDKILAIRETLKTGPFMAGYKYACELVGIPAGMVRRPLSGLSQGEKDKIHTGLQKLNLI